MRKFLNITLLAIVSSMCVETSLASSNKETTISSMRGTPIDWNSLLSIPTKKNTSTVSNDVKNKPSSRRSLIRPCFAQTLAQSLEQSETKKQSIFLDGSLGNKMIIRNKISIENELFDNDTDNNKPLQKKSDTIIGSNIINLGEKNNILKPKIVQNSSHKKNKNKDIEISISTDLHDKKQTKPAELLRKKRGTAESSKSKNNKMTQQQKDKKNQKSRIERKLENLKLIGEEIVIYAQQTASNSDKIVSMLNSILQYQKQNSKVEQKKDIGNKAKKNNLKQEGTQSVQQPMMEIQSSKPVKYLKRIADTDFDELPSNEERLKYLFIHEQNNDLFKTRLLKASRFILCDDGVVHIKASNGKQKWLRTVWDAMEYITSKLLCIKPIALFDVSEKADQLIIENNQVNNFLITAILLNIFSKNTILYYINNERQIEKFDTQCFDNRRSLVTKITDEFIQSTNNIASTIADTFFTEGKNATNENKLEEVKWYVRFSNVLHDNPIVNSIPINIPYYEYTTLKTIKDVFECKFLPPLKEYFSLPGNAELVDVAKIELGLNVLNFLNPSSDCSDNKIEV